MSNDIEQLAARLRALIDEWGIDAARAAFEKQAAGLAPDQRARLSQLTFGTHNQFGDVHIDEAIAGAKLTTGDNTGSTVAVGTGASATTTTQGTLEISGRVYGPAVGLNLGAIIYGRDPREDERRRLVWYLDALANEMRRLPLRLDTRLAEGRGIDLARIYVMLATEAQVEVAQGRNKELRRYYTDGKLNQPLKPAYDPDRALPDRAILRVEERPAEQARRAGSSVRVLWRARLATEAVQQQRRLVLLGDPGSGKSTFLRHLAWALALHGLDQEEQDMALVGWDGQHRLLPVLLPLRRLASRLAREGGSAQTVYTTCRDELHSCGLPAADDPFREALLRGTALVLLDGLDEVPLEATAEHAGRLDTLRAIRAFADRYRQARLVITCRTRAFEQDARLSACLDWPTATLARFTLGQMRHFVPAWYRELAAAGQLPLEQAGCLGDELVAAITGDAQLRRMAGTPLLLTMMALLLFRRGTLPRDRARLYEEIIELLLDQWDKLDKQGQSLAEVIGRAELTSQRLRPLLDRLSYEAHRDATSVDGRGRLRREDVRNALITFFEQQTPPLGWDAAQRCLAYMEQRSGLLVADAQDSYVFAHLTLQEHCAGRHLALARDAAHQVLAHRTEDRWREPIFLGLGVVQQSNPYLVEAVLRKLLAREEAVGEGETAAPKPVARWYRDLIMAAEIGVDRGWSYLRDQGVDTPDLQRALRAGLVTLLADRDQPLPTVERVRAGFYLGGLGDPRFPVEIGAWSAEIVRAVEGGVSGYLCQVPAGIYHIGSGNEDPDARDEEKPRHSVTFDQPFWIARYPVTNAQWEAWVKAGGNASYFANDSDLNRPNQPVIGINWRMANNFCAWLSEQLRDVLPKGYELRLPTEQEWEAAARGGDSHRRYPWGDEWQEDRAATEEDEEARGWRWSVPVGCYPAGTASCGALDMAGNVWEWTVSVWQSYPGADKFFTDDLRVMRGGSYMRNRTFVRCGARGGNRPVLRVVSNVWGVRVCLAPALAQMF